MAIYGHMTKSDTTPTDDGPLPPPEDKLSDFENMHYANLFLLGLYMPVYCIVGLFTYISIFSRHLLGQDGQFDIMYCLRII